jgi:hypothetical protein
MSFTVNGTNWQTAAKLEELRMAYSERLYVRSGVWRKWRNDGSGKGEWVIGDGTSGDALAVGTDISHSLFFSEMQQFLSSSFNIQLFVPPGDYSSNRADVSTLAELATAASMAGGAWEYLCKEVLGTGTGLYDGTNYGFRRSTDGVTFTRAAPGGAMAAGDIIGEWVFEDLKDVFNALTITRVAAGEAYDGVSLAEGSSFGHETLAEAKAAAVTAKTVYADAGSTYSEAYLVLDDYWYDPPRYGASYYAGEFKLLAEVAAGLESYFTAAVQNYFAFIELRSGEFVSTGGVVRDLFNHGGTKALNVRSDLYGDHTTPAWPTGTPAAGDQIDAGWQVKSGAYKFAVIDWKFSDQVA